MQLNCFRKRGFLFGKVGDNADALEVVVGLSQKNDDFPNVVDVVLPEWKILISFMGDILPDRLQVPIKSVEMILCRH